MVPGTYPRIGNASIDRVDNTKGYVPGNIVWVDKDVNMMKGRLGVAWFIELSHRIAQTTTEVMDGTTLLTFPQDIDGMSVRQYRRYQKRPN